MTVEHFIKENRGTIVDVRTREEFMGGHVATSINIPLNEIPERLEEIKALATPLILCCASGGRSGQSMCAAKVNSEEVTSKVPLISPLMYCVKI